MPSPKTPSAAQIQAGNYQKGHVWAHGMRISIENPAGSVRSGTDKEGNPWDSRMQHDYGYVRGTTGADKDHIDVFLGPEYKDRSLPVHVIDQYDPDTGAFDEHKAMMGFASPEEAVQAYHANYHDGWAGARAVTPMHVDNFRAWATSPGARSQPLAGNSKVAWGSDTADRSAPQGYAGGGTVGKVPDYSAPSNFLADPRSWSDMGNNLGAVSNRLATGLAGTPVDLATMLQNYLGRQSAWPPAALLHQVLQAKHPELIPKQVEHPVLGTDWLRDKLAQHGGSSTTGNELADNIGDVSTMALTMPGAARQAAGMVGSAAKTLGRHAAQTIDDAMHGEGPLRTALAPAAPAFAVKPKGGNWMPDRLESYLNDFLPREGNQAVGDWKAKQLQNYMKTYLGTAEDPLLKNESEGRMHISPEDLLRGSQEAGVIRRTQVMGDQEVFPVRGVYGTGGNPAAVKYHMDTTGRNYRTPWENLADNQTYQMKPKEAIADVSGNWMADGEGVDSVSKWLEDMRGNGFPEDELADMQKKYGWLDKAPADAPIHTMVDPHWDPLQFGHVVDYLNAATDAHAGLQNAGSLERMQALAPDNPATAMVARGLHLSPEQLSRTSVPDAVAKTGQWNAMLAEGKRLEDMNKGVKSVLKQYPTGHQWVDLAPEGLQAEGDAMRHCVGGYCSAVEGGNTRILSLRDPQGQPKVTVELRPGVPAQTISRIDRANDPRVAQTSPQWTHFNEDTGQLYDESNAGDYTDMFDAKRSTPPAIRQIKGPANRMPSAEVLPMVQDLVKGGVHPELSNWGSVNDLDNTGLVQLKNGKGYTTRDAIDAAARTHLGMDANYAADPRALDYYRHVSRLDPAQLSDADNAFVNAVHNPPAEPDAPGYASGGLVSESSPGTQQLAPLGGWGWGYMNGTTAAPSSSAAAPDFTLPTVTAGGHSTTDILPTGSRPTDYSSGTPGANTGAARAVGEAANWASAIGSVAHDPALRQIGGYAGALAGASQGQYGGLGALAGGLATKTPVGALAGALAGGALSDTPASARDVASTVTSFAPGVGTAYSLGNFLTNGKLADGLYGSNAQLGLGGAYTPAKEGWTGLDLGANLGSALMATPRVQGAEDPLGRFTSLMGGFQDPNGPDNSSPQGTYSPDRSGGNEPAGPGTNGNPGKAADDHESPGGGE